MHEQKVSSMKKILFAVVILFFISCGDKKEREIAQIPMEFETIRFDSLFFLSPVGKLSELKKEYPYLFSAYTEDEKWEEYQKDTLNQEIVREINKVFGDFSNEKTAIKHLFQHVKYYFPKFVAPKVITVTSEVDYHSRVIYADSLLFIQLDNYLGEEHYFYENIQKYIRSELKKEHIVTDIAETFAEKLVPRNQHLSFLDHMIYEGKKLYLLSQLLPKKSDGDLLKYDSEKTKWATENESQIWRYFIENELLYQTNKQLLNRFIYPAPFSKFYLELDNESPGQIGRYIGLQIVKSYAQKNNGKSLIELLAMDADEIFKQSFYKPKK